MRKTHSISIVLFIVILGCSKNTSEQNETIKAISSKADSLNLSSLENGRDSTISKIDIVKSAFDTVVISQKQQIKLDTTVYKYFKDTTLVDFHLYSPDLNNDSTDQLFIGKPITSKYYKYFKSDDFELEYEKGGYKIFACYKFKFNLNKTGLIIRTPPEYAETAIRLVVVNEKNFIENNFEIANGFGDGGWSFNKDAWIEQNNSESFKIVTRRRDRWMDDEDMEKMYYRDSLEIYNYLNPNFRVIRGNFNSDTNKYKLRFW